MIKYYCDNCGNEIPWDKPIVVKNEQHFCMDCIVNMIHARIETPPAAPEPKPKPKTAQSGSKYDFEKAYAMWEAGKSGRRKPYTQKEIANEIGCSHQRIAQLVKKWEQEYEG